MAHGQGSRGDCRLVHEFRRKPRLVAGDHRAGDELILRRTGQPYAAVSIAGIYSRLTGPRREELAQMLHKETRTLARKLDEMSVSWE